MAQEEQPAGAATPNIARIYDYLLGGQHHYQADRDVAQALLAAAPDARATMVENRRFLIRAVRYLAGQGIRQFLDIGAGLPTQENVHQVAQQAAPDARVVYVDIDPEVVAHARTLLPPGGQVAAVTGDLRQPERILSDPGVLRLLDFSGPVALLLVGVLYFIPDSEDPYGMVARLRAALAPGSYLALAHATGDVSPAGNVEAGTRAYRPASEGVTLRSRAQVGRFLTGLDLVEPGLVLMPDWRPDGGPPEPGAAGYAAVGRVPGGTRAAGSQQAQSSTSQPRPSS